MPLPLAAAGIAKVAAPFIMKGIGKLFGNKGKKKALKEQQRAEQEQINNKYKSDFDTFENREDDRTMRMQGIANQLTGARALSPQVIQAALQRRRNTAYKGSVVDKTKGMDLQLAGDAAGGIGDIAGSMLKEGAIADAEGGGQGMSPEFAPSTSSGPVSMGGQTFDFRRKPGSNF